MSKKKKFGLILVWVILVEIALTAIWLYFPNITKTMQFSVEVSSDVVCDYQVFYTSDLEVSEKSFDAKNGVTATLESENNVQKLVFDIPSDTTFVRFDCGTRQMAFQLSAAELVYKDSKVEIPMNDLTSVTSYKDISSYFINEEGIIEGIAEKGDPYLVWNISQYDMSTVVREKNTGFYWALHIVATLFVLGVSLLVYKFRRKILEIPKELYENRKLIFSLAKTDFKTKYSASYFGTLWAFAQPIVTIAIYVFVFQVGFKAAPTTTGYPFVLYLVAGIIPWFFFAEGWMNATNCLVEYDYLVKKVVFKISILPIVKVLSSLFVHLFFIALALVVFVLNGSIPGATFVQIFYYLFCTICFTLALSYFTAAITPFFQDISQIINIITQLGMWTIPIMYDEAIMGEKIMRVLKFNPMYYVVTGYRDCYMHGQWVWERTKLTIYFWLVVCVLFYIGFKTFKKLKVHFADVL